MTASPRNLERAKKLVEEWEKDPLTKVITWSGEWQRPDLSDHSRRDLAARIAAFKCDEGLHGAALQLVLEKLAAAEERVRGLEDAILENSDWDYKNYAWTKMLELAETIRARREGKP